MRFLIGMVLCVLAIAGEVVIGTLHAATIWHVIPDILISVGFILFFISLVKPKNSGRKSLPPQ